MSAVPPFPAEFIEPWRDLLKATHDDQIDDFPNYHVFNTDSLVTTSIPKDLFLGTGLSIFTRALLPAMLEAKRSIHFVTCYWAASPSRDAFRETLVQLAEKRRQQRDIAPLKISIGFSSSGLFQKLFHTGSTDGYTYPASRWGELGLPSEDVLRDARIELKVKSLFFTPFSVMHPKYLVVDEEKAWVPSCNVSWERWFEGCVAVEGNVVSKLLTFHEKVWGTGGWSGFGDGLGTPPRDGNENGDVLPEALIMEDNDDESAEAAVATQSYRFKDRAARPTIFLPSPHHRNPHLGLFPILSQTNPPITPLNAALLTLFRQARNQITILTPNVTSWPALEALLEALERGVDVQIRTSKNMMFIEQLVTAGTWTSRCLNQFVKRYKAMVEARSRGAGPDGDVEARRGKPGRLEILYYKESAERTGMDDEPVVSHFKMTMVDGEYVMFGSGNMDRASWWTSQEIGVLFWWPGFEGRTAWERVLSARTEVMFTV